VVAEGSRPNVCGWPSSDAALPDVLLLPLLLLLLLMLLLPQPLMASVAASTVAVLPTDRR
jgi:hypothetical protein